MSLGKSSVYVFALHTFEAMQTGDLAFRAGDLLLVDEASMRGEQGWIFAENPRTGKLGQIPSNYVTRETGYSAALDAFRNENRESATATLKSVHYNCKFNYLLRPSSLNATMALSVLTLRGVVHFKIYFDRNKGICNIYPKPIFETIEDLIIYYMDNVVTDGIKLQAYQPFKDFSKGFT